MIIPYLKKHIREKSKDILTSVIHGYQKENNIINIKVLDVGAGNCWLLHLLPPECMKVGLDLHTHQHFIDNTFMDFLNTKSSHFVFGDATNLPFPDATFDVVYSNEFVSHVRDIDETLKEQIKVLKRGGILLIMDGNPLNPETFFHCFIANYLTSRKSEIKRGGVEMAFSSR
jgi:ubiquinone/menaquinone biosynthesis C-methylase UbiE